MLEAATIVGIFGHIGPYDPKSMEWITYKGRFTFFSKQTVLLMQLSREQLY